MNKNSNARKIFPIVPITFLNLPFRSKFIITFQTIALHDCSQDILISDPMTTKKKKGLVYREGERRQIRNLY